VTRLGYGRDAMNRVTNHVDSGIASVYDRYRYEQENMKIMIAVAKHFMGLASGNAAPENVIRLAR
jgi:hypothetical protein